MFKVIFFRLNTCSSSLDVKKKNQAAQSQRDIFHLNFETKYVLSLSHHQKMTRIISSSEVSARSIFRQSLTEYFGNMSDSHQKIKTLVGGAHYLLPLEGCLNLAVLVFGVDEIVSRDSEIKKIAGEIRAVEKFKFSVVILVSTVGGSAKENVGVEVPNVVTRIQAAYFSSRSKTNIRKPVPIFLAIDYEDAWSRMEGCRNGLLRERVERQREIFAGLKRHREGGVKDRIYRAIDRSIITRGGVNEAFLRSVQEDFSRTTKTSKRRFVDFLERCDLEEIQKMFH